MAKKKIEYCCIVCKSNDVGLDAWAEWDVTEQKWTLRNTYSAPFCFTCDRETQLEEIRI